jgi:transposase
VRVLARTCAGEAACPGCGGVSRQVHSRYQRKLADVASGGQEVLICLQARRFLCRSEACPKVTFAEQVPGLTVRRVECLVWLIVVNLIPAGIGWLAAMSWLS